MTGAYDVGATDSGIRDDDLSGRCFMEVHLRAQKDRDGLRMFLGASARDLFLSPEALARGYGLGDVVEFARWLSDAMQFHVTAL